MNIINRSTWLLAASTAAAMATAAWAADTISGAGATFPAPIYAKWAEAYQKEMKIGLNYQSIGSGGGIAQIKNSTVTFGASDMPLKPDDLQSSGLVQWPMIIGGVVPALNLPGVKPGELVLDGPTLADMYMGTITKWNDPRIKQLNPGVTLPATAIAPVYRSDGSGTNFLFTTYLSSVSPKFKAEVGANTSVSWPTGLGAKGNEGVSNMTARTAGAIGYVEYAYAKQNHLTYAKIKNHDGKVVSPEIKAFQAAAASADWSKAPGYYLILVDQPGAESWPITGASFILMHNQVKSGEDALTALKFFSWAYVHGDQMAEDLDYVPIPDNVVKMVEQTWSKSIMADGKAVWKQ